MIVEIHKFVTQGKEFNTRAEAEEYQASLLRRDEQRYEDFISNRYAGRKLLESHDLDEEGTWEILGEDPNPDMGGYHHQPHLGFFEGTLEKVIRKAISLPGFYAWGAGGSITKTSPPEVTRL